MCDNYRSMSHTMSELLRKALADAPSLLSVEKATGLHRASLQRFRDGETSLRLDLADRLAAHFGITSRQTRKAARK